MTHPLYVFISISIKVKNHLYQRFVILASIVIFLLLFSHSSVICQITSDNFLGTIRYKGTSDHGDVDTVDLYMGLDKIKLDFNEGYYIELMGFRSRVSIYKSILWNTSENDCNAEHWLINYDGNIISRDTFYGFELVGECYPDSTIFILDYPCKCYTYKRSSSENQYGYFTFEKEVWMTDSLTFKSPNKCNVKNRFISSGTGRIALLTISKSEGTTIYGDLVPKSNLTYEAIQSFSEVFHRMDL